MGAETSALPTCENTLFPFEPISRTAPTTVTRMTASITEYSAMSVLLHPAKSCAESGSGVSCRYIVRQVLLSRDVPDVCGTEVTN